LELKPVIGLSSFLELAGWLTLAFGVMFQFPIAIVLTVSFGLVKPSFLSSKRPYVIVFILIMSAILIPPDVLSQILLAIPTYLLFEIGLFLSHRFEKFEKKGNSEQYIRNNESKTIENNRPSTRQKSDNGTLDFYIKEEKKRRR
jgi:Sec-independent protein secretion pathway component TatC